MKILVTGGAGFIGSHIVDKYISLGHDVFVLDSLVTGSKKFVNQKAELIQVDIRDRKAIAQVMGKIRPEVLNHHAAQMEVRRSVSEPTYDAEVNLLGLLNLLEEGRKYALKKVIFASSGGAIYGDAKTLPTPESYWPQPASPYGISKLTSEFYLDFYHQAYNIDYSALRYGNVYGPRQNPHGEAGVIAIFVKKLLAGEQSIINGDGTQTRDFVFVGDVVEANIKALSHNKPLITNIGTGIQTSVNDIFDLLVRLAGVSQPKQHGPAKPGEQKVSQLDITKANKELGWQPQVTLETGLTETVKYFKNEKN